MNVVEATSPTIQKVESLDSTRHLESSVMRFILFLICTYIKDIIKQHSVRYLTPFFRYDPFGFNKNMSEETKERRLIAEINNGRLAQLGIFGFLAADAVPGSVPLLSGIAKGYSGNPMIPFEGQFSYFDYIGGPN